MKITEHFDVPKNVLPNFLKELTGIDITITSNTNSDKYHITTKIDYTEPEYNMLVLRTALNNHLSLTDEEKNAIEYSIAAIKTLADMGVIK